MANQMIIRDREIVADDWITVGDDEPIPNGDVIVSWERWLADGEAILARPGRIGVRINGEHDARDLTRDLQQFALVVIEFPTYADGRGYSHARILRDQLGFSGELRASGNVLRDQIFYLARVGFNAFESDGGKSLESVLEGLNDFSVTYQAAADEPRPLYRRKDPAFANASAKH